MLLEPGEFAARHAQVASETGGAPIEVSDEEFIDEREIFAELEEKLAVDEFSQGDDPLELGYDMD